MVHFKDYGSGNNSRLTTGMLELNGIVNELELTDLPGCQFT